MTIDCIEILWAQKFLVSAFQKLINNKTTLNTHAKKYVCISQSSATVEMRLIKKSQLAAINEFIGM